MTANTNTLTGLRKIKADRARAHKASLDLARQRRDEYVADITAQMDLLKSLINEHHMGANPNWADVGSLTHILEQLTDLTASYAGDED